MSGNLSFVSKMVLGGAHKPGQQLPDTLLHLAATRRSPSDCTGHLAWLCGHDGHNWQLVLLITY